MYKIENQDLKVKIIKDTRKTYYVIVKYYLNHKEVQSKVLYYTLTNFEDLKRELLELFKTQVQHVIDNSNMNPSVTKKIFKALK